MTRLKTVTLAAGRILRRKRVLAGLVAAVLAARGATMDPAAQDQLVNALLTVLAAFGGA